MKVNNKRAGAMGALAVFAAAAILLGLAGSQASAAPRQDTNAALGFAKLQTLVGTWEATTEKGRVTTTYESVSKGTALLERMKVPGETEMVTLYHLDGGNLVLTHYCSAGNQPHMQAGPFDPARNQLVFNFAGGGNLQDPNVGHMHSAVFTFTGPDEFTSQWTFQQGGQARFTENMQFHRVK